MFTLKENIRVRVKFLIRKEKRQSFDISVNDDSTEVIVKLLNSNNPKGTEFTNMIEIGNINNRKLFMHLRVIGMNKSNNRVLFYTFLLGDTID